MLSFLAYQGYSNNRSPLQGARAHIMHHPILNWKIKKPPHTDSAMAPQCQLIRLHKITIPQDVNI